MSIGIQLLKLKLNKEKIKKFAEDCMKSGGYIVVKTGPLPQHVKKPAFVVSCYNVSPDKMKELGYTSKTIYVEVDEQTYKNIVEKKGRITKEFLKLIGVEKGVKKPTRVIVLE